MNKVFLDTNVVLDFLLDRRPFSEQASKIFDLSELGEIELFISSLSVNNIYYIARKIIGHEKSIYLIKELLGMVEILNSDKASLLMALELEFSDFEGGIQNAIAILNPRIEIIISRNTKDFRKSALPAMSPEIYLKTFFH